LAVSYVYGGDISDVEGLKAYASFKEEEWIKYHYYPIDDLVRDFEEK
jgi:hypothetical protein